jgi:MFS family permease
MLPLAAATFVPLVATALRPPVWLAAMLWCGSGVGLAYQLPANAVFVAALPAYARGRAFGLAQSGLQVLQGLSLAGAGALALRFSPAAVIALSGALGLLSVAALAARWPEPEPAALEPGAPEPAAAEPEPLPAFSWTAPYPLRPHPRVLVARLVPLDPP